MQEAFFFQNCQYPAAKTPLYLCLSPFTVEWGKSPGQKPPENIHMAYELILLQAGTC